MEERDFEHAARSWQRRIFTFAAYFLGDAAEAEEITQEVLVRLWRHPQMLFRQIQLLEPLANPRACDGQYCPRWH